MTPRRRRTALDYAPAIALLAFWALAGLSGAITVAQADGSLRHLALAVVTLPYLVLVARAMRAVGHARDRRHGTTDTGPLEGRP